MKYVCDHCAKEYNTEFEAELCEQSHQQQDYDEINRLINLYVAEYGEFPPIHIDEDSKTLLVSKVIADSFIFEDDADDDEDENDEWDEDSCAQCECKNCTKVADDEGDWI